MQLPSQWIIPSDADKVETVSSRFRVELLPSLRPLNPSLAAVDGGSRVPIVSPPSRSVPSWCLVSPAVAQAPQIRLRVVWTSSFVELSISWPSLNGPAFVTNIEFILFLLLAGDSTSILPNITPPLRSSSCMDAFLCLRRFPGCSATGS
ncbi:hypothetical protein TgHK011_007694 [Trichoderma gracile]|nr:hypothetical protein TgHK011_007694 [Trichoderma gracile]